eukprot:2000556-Alexandrium_andersonii.AAC.1
MREKAHLLVFGGAVCSARSSGFPSQDTANLSYGPPSVRWTWRTPPCLQWRASGSRMEYTRRASSVTG